MSEAIDVARPGQLLSRAMKLIEQATEPKELGELARDAEGLRVLIQRLGLGLEVQNKAALAKFLAQRKAGEILSLLPKHSGGRPTQTGNAALPVSTLDELGVTKIQSSRWQRLYGQVPTDEMLMERAVDATAQGLELTEPFLLGKAHVSANGGDNEWYTPPEYIKAALEVMGSIDLDPASSEAANAVVRAERFYTAEDNGLQYAWAGNVWMNPPYARPLIDEFCAKLAEHYSAGDVTQACVLVNNATETGWFHALAEVACAMCGPRKRVKFWAEDKSNAGPLQGQTVVYLGRNLEQFKASFVQFGWIAAFI